MKAVICEKEGPEDEVWAGQLMAGMQPWLKLGRAFPDCLQAVQESRLGLARVDGQRAGFILWTCTGLLNGYIRTIAVAPEFQGQGLGQQLIGHAEEAIRQQSPNVFLCVSGFNPRARSLYERLGYVQVGLLKDFIILGEDEILMRKAGTSWQEFRDWQRNTGG